MQTKKVDEACVRMKNHNMGQRDTAAHMCIGRLSMGPNASGMKVRLSQPTQYNGRDKATTTTTERRTAMRFQTKVNDFIAQMRHNVATNIWSE